MRITYWSSDGCSSDLVGFEARPRIVVEDAERHREFAEAHLDEHVRDAAVGDVMDDHARRLPVAIDHIDDLEFERILVERDALGAPRLLATEQHRLAVPEPELTVLGALRRGEVLKHVLVIDDAVLENLDERRDLVRVDRKSTRLNSSH